MVAPHFGGVHETMIKTAKRAAYAILGSVDVTDEELLTVFTGAKARINSRPLTYQLANPLDEVPLTPNHFLFGQVGGQFAPETVDSSQFSQQKHWRLPTLNRSTKWRKEQKDIQVNDVVLVTAPDMPRRHWPLGRVQEVYPGKDRHV